MDTMGLIILFVISLVFFIVLTLNNMSFQSCPKCGNPWSYSNCRWIDKTNELVSICSRCSYTKKEKK